MTEEITGKACWGIPGLLFFSPVGAAAFLSVYMGVNLGETVVYNNSVNCEGTVKQLMNSANMLPEDKPGVFLPSN